MIRRETAKLQKLLMKGTRKELKRGEVFQNTESILNMSLVLQGYVKRYTIRNDGGIAIQSIYGPGDFFPLTLAHKLLLNQDLYSGPEVIHYEAINDLVLYTIDNETLKKEVEKDQNYFKELFYVSGVRLHSNIQMLENLSLHDFHRRVAHQLLYIAKEFGKETKDGVHIEVPLTQQDIADILSATRETVSLSIRSLQKKGLVKIAERKHFLIPDMNMLSDEAYA